MKLARTVTICIALLMVFSLQAGAQSAPAQAFKNVTIHTNGNTIESGTIVWRNGVITAIGEEVSIPFDAYVRDGGDSLHVYPGFIDGMALWGSPEPKEYDEAPDEPGNPTYERAGIQPFRHPASLLEVKDKSLVKAQKHGFTTAALGLKGQMLPGQIDLFFINGEKTQNYILDRGIGVLAQFEGAQGAAYPSTLMGVMAQYRQLFYDAKAQMQQQVYFASVGGSYPAPDHERVLEALYPVMKQQQPFYFVVNSDENIERLFTLQDELGFDVILVSGKEAYKKADELKERNIPVLVSIDLPEKPEWKTDDKEDENLTDEKEHFRKRQMEAYKADVTNIKKLLEAGVKVGYASNGLKLSKLHENISTLLDEGGLSEDQILKLFTKSTADILGYGQKMGDLKKGHIASFSVFTKPFIEKDTSVLYSVSNGEVMEFEPESSKKSGDKDE
ncbi:MAG TPA: amidohydrolase family protein [Balneolaceae bacterium]|nr:amidohydrolase family protein [Balneolaceae bacterium]